jgi:hypothetical protein
VLACSPAGRATFVASRRTFNARACWTARSARRSCSRARAPCRPRQRSSAVAHPAVERTMHDGDAPLEDSVRDGAPATAGAPSTGGVQSSCCVAYRVERPERRGRQQRGGQRAPAPREDKLGKNNCHKIGKAKRSRSDLRGCGAESLLGIDESTQEKGLRAKGPIWYGD